MQIDDDGTVHLGPRTVPVPRTVSAEARRFLATPPWPEPLPPWDQLPMWKMRAATDTLFRQLSDIARTLYPVTVEATTVGGVRAQVVRPLEVPVAHRGRVLVNLHGGGFVLGSGSLIEAIPIAHLTRTPVIAVDYRLAPEHRFPAAVDDALAVYRAVLADHDPRHVGIYGASAGGMLTAQAVVRIEREGLPRPACVGLFTMSGDFADYGDTAKIFSLAGFWGHTVLPTDHACSEARAYLGDADRRDPLVSPIHADLSRFPPALLVSGTRDALLSSTTIFHRALRRAGANADLFVFEAMPHAHWYLTSLPESQEALQVMARFFDAHLGG